MNEIGITCIIVEIQFLNFLFMIQEELEKIRQQGASEDEQKRLIEQHERDLQNILNKMDADKMRMQSNLQERLKKKKDERLKNKQEELKENYKDQKREMEQKQKSEINRIKKDEVGGCILVKMMISHLETLSNFHKVLFDMLFFTLTLLCTCIKKRNLSF